MLGQLSGQDQTDGGLDFPAGDGGTLVVVGKLGSFTGNTLEDIVDEGVHDSHSFAGDTSVGVDLLQDLVDVDGITLTSLLPAASLACWLGGLSSLLGAFGARRRVEQASIRCHHRPGRCTAQHPGCTSPQEDPESQVNCTLYGFLPQRPFSRPPTSSKKRSILRSVEYVYHFIIYLI